MHRSGQALESIASKIGCTAETLRKWARQSETDQGIRGDLSNSERERLQQLEREKSAGKFRLPHRVTHEHNAREHDPDRLPDRIKRDKVLEREIQRVWDGNFKVYGANKVWRQLLREGIRIARCTVERLMKKLGIQDIRRGKKCWTTIADDLFDRKPPTLPP